MFSTHSGQLERWLGRDAVAHLSHSMRDWYGPPIAVQGVPGRVYVGAGGDFSGKIRAGGFASARDRADEILLRGERRRRAEYHRFGRATRQGGMAGFTSLSDLISEATSGGKKRDFYFVKGGSTGVVAVTSTLWRNGAQPVGGNPGAAAPGGTAHTSSDTGTIGFTNPSGGDTQHYVSGWASASVINNTLMLYDRLFSVAKTMNSTGTEAVTGVPTRYQSTTATNPDSAGGNFLFIEVGGTALAATAHNWTVCQYKDQSGAASTLPSVTGNSGAITDRLDIPAGFWFCPLEAGDTGIQQLTQMQCSALVATGAINFVIGHPICVIPCQIANMVCKDDGINTAFNLTRIFDSACLALLELCKPATTGTNYIAQFSSVAG